MGIRFVFALHNHQPVGNFDGVFEGAYRDSYAPFLELLEGYPEIPISLHTSGCLMEWLVEHKPEYVDRLRRFVARGQIEIMGGGFYEPILPMIPPRDRVGQIRSYTEYLQKLFQTKVRGMWVPERVWEQNLVSDIAAAGIEYTVLDDYHFKQAGLEEQQLFGYYLSEDNGRLIRIFPGSERMRYLVPFRNPEETIAYFGEVAGRNQDAVIVFADDGEKFGSWPETHKHCYDDGWLRRFLDALRQARSWVRFCTFSQALDETAPAGKIYLPDCSYREMTEWALPVPKLIAYQHLMHDLDHDHRLPEIKRFLRGGYWHNYKIKYPEIQEMYGRMMHISRRLSDVEDAGSRIEDRESNHEARDQNQASFPSSILDPQSSILNPLLRARQELYRAQCNCPWWHGAFGGLYLPHLRNATYHHLIKAENALLFSREASRGARPGAESEQDDWDFDGHDEVCLRNHRLAVFFKPDRGGSLYELDLRVIAHNLLATLSRRPEAYHETIRRHAESGSDGQGAQSIHDRVVFKQAGLERLLQYDPYLRKSLIDHFYEPTRTVEDLTALKETELGDFVTGAYEGEVQRTRTGVEATFRRNGQVAGAPVRIRKSISLSSEADALDIHYRLENVPKDRALHFAVEFNFAGMAAGADDRYFYHNGQARAGQLQSLQNLSNADGIGLVDEWLGLDVSLALSKPGGIWAFPIQTVSQSEGGFELVHQSTAVLPHWHIQANADGSWEVSIRMNLDVSRAEKRQPASFNPEPTATVSKTEA
ncbi:MAG TPA: alpha-amylase/4-alpha-glucanotransferase domain-containing protein [Gemmataceae bacterium]|nr:alpha-amylase/4-alpha-glucanotransferase domain-containing protein [Gemmataceae bacterium]